MHLQAAVQGSPIQALTAEKNPSGFEPGDLSKPSLSYPDTIRVLLIELVESTQLP